MHAFNNGGTMKIVAIAALLLAATPAAAQVHTPENSHTEQAHIWARYDATHGRDNQHDTRSYDERFPGATPGKKLDCSVSHDSGTKENTISGCRYVPR